MCFALIFSTLCRGCFYPQITHKESKADEVKQFPWGPAADNEIELEFSSIKHHSPFSPKIHTHILVIIVS